MAVAAAGALSGKAGPPSTCRVQRAMDALRCPPPDALVANLSGGERRRVAICRLLLQVRAPQIRTPQGNF